MGFSSWLWEFKNAMRPAVKELTFVLSKIRRNPLSLVGAIIVLFFVAVALLAPVLAPPVPGQDPYICPYYGPTWGWYIKPLPTPPSETNPFGTLEGFDIYYGCIWGTRTVFRTSSLVILGALAIGLLIGCVAGYRGGLIDEVLMRFSEMFFAFPGLLLAVLLILVLPYELPVDLGLISFTVTASTMDKLVIALVLVRWPSYARIIRGEIMKTKNEDYIEAAKAVGCSGRRILIRHILPNSIYPVLIMAFLDVGGVVLSFATLNFLGFGMENDYQAMGYTHIPLYADWATIISHSRQYILGTSQSLLTFSYTFIIPAIFISTFILGWSLLGDALRSILDPMIRRR